MEKTGLCPKGTAHHRRVSFFGGIFSQKGKQSVFFVFNAARDHRIEQGAKRGAERFSRRNARFEQIVSVHGERAQRDSRPLCKHGGETRAAILFPRRFAKRGTVESGLLAPARQKAQQILFRRGEGPAPEPHGREHAAADPV